MARLVILVVSALLLSNCAVLAEGSNDDGRCFISLAHRQYETKIVVEHIEENVGRPSQYVAVKLLTQIGYDYLILGAAQDRGFILAYHTLTGVSSHDIPKEEALRLITEIAAAVEKSDDTPGRAAFGRESCAIIRVSTIDQSGDIVRHNKMPKLEYGDWLDIDDVLRAMIDMPVPNPFIDDVVLSDPPEYSQEQVDAYLTRVKLDNFFELAEAW
jgi:hypothetical protein